MFEASGDVVEDGGVFRAPGKANYYRDIADFSEGGAKSKAASSASLAYENTCVWFEVLKKQAKFAKEYCAKVEVELGKTCNSILSLLDGNLISKSTIGEPMAFYRKMKEDYYRYIAKFSKMTPKTKLRRVPSLFTTSRRGWGANTTPKEVAASSKEEGFDRVLRRGNKPTGREHPVSGQEKCREIEWTGGGQPFHSTRN
jgi:hypothetical protein